MKMILLSVLVFVNLSVFASGPSYEEVEVQTIGTDSAKTEALACNKAREAALYNVYDLDVDYYNYSGTCTYQDDIEVVKSTCSCSYIKNSSTYNCEYKADVMCLMEMWYNY